MSLYTSNDAIYVIGHVNPDTDSIASAIGYAWLLQERDHENFIPARAGAINPQTAWVLKLLGMNPPLLVSDASPRFDSVVRRLDGIAPDRSLTDAWAIANKTGGLVPVIEEDGNPFGLITGRSLFKFLSEVIGPHIAKNDNAFIDIFSLPCGNAADKTIHKFNQNYRIRDNINRILREEGDEFWVVDDHGKYVGICKQRDLLNPPRLKVILVDHNEPQQSIANLGEAEILEVLDHHRLGNPHTHTPIKFSVDIVGSTSTLVSEKMEEAGLRPFASIAGIMLAGLLSDTLLLTSPTTTSRDHIAAERLARWAITSQSPLQGETIKSFGEKVLAASSGLGTRSADEIIKTDLKIYTSGDFSFSVSQAEVSNLNEADNYFDKITIALEALCKEKGLNFSALMITDVVQGSSRLIFYNRPSELDSLPYAARQDGTFFAKGVVSRKKQLLPVLLGLLDV